MVTNVIITMAGEGSRFRLAGYELPKYEIPVNGRTLFSWSMESLRSWIDADARFVFVTRRAHGAKDFLDAQSKALGIRKWVVVELNEPTDGQATTALAAEAAVSNREAPMLIYNIDTHVAPAHLSRTSVRGDGWIPCFRPPGDHWSFAKADSRGRVSELREKSRISPDATIGLYWFASWDLYEQSYSAYYSDPAHLVRGERYVAPIYNELIAQNRPVFIHPVPLDSVIPLGTPAEVEQFRRSSRFTGAV